MKRLVITWILFLLALPLMAIEPPTLVAIRQTLIQSPAAELPAAAAGLVQEASERSRGPIASNVVRTAVELNPAATPLVVGEVSRVSPDVAGVSAAVATMALPARVEEITIAAVGATPPRAGEIVAAVCKACPDAYRTVALLAGRVAPQKSAAILHGVALARPELKPFLDQQLAAAGRTGPSIRLALDRAELARERTSVPSRTLPEGRGVEPQADSLSPDKRGDKPPHGNGSPPGGRNYAKP